MSTKPTNLAKSSKSVKRTTSSGVYSCPQPFLKVYQFKVTLLETDPPVWRRIQVPGCYSFWDLHCAITDAFGWLDYHLHLFTLRNPKTAAEDHIGIPDDGGADEDIMGYATLPGWMTNISRFFTLKPDNLNADYLYDFGDGWHHSVVLEVILPRKIGEVYPRCIGGEKACPPEDCGGSSGYRRFKKAIAYHNAEDHDASLSWVGGWFDPEWLDLGLIRFQDPHLRWEIAFQDKPCPKNIRMVQYHRMKKG
ncbi:MAG: plasmid pRiA4b ORF-3 family protein [bacterium]|jgi:hypothetical protein